MVNVTFNTYPWENAVIHHSYAKAKVLFASFRFCVCDHFRLKDSYGAFLDHWVHSFGVFKFGVIEAAVHNGNTRLQHMRLGLEYSSVRSIIYLLFHGMFSVSWPPLKTSCSYLTMI